MTVAEPGLPPDMAECSFARRDLVMNAAKSFTRIRSCGAPRERAVPATGVSPTTGALADQSQERRGNNSTGAGVRAQAYRGRRLCLEQIPQRWTVGDLTRRSRVAISRHGRWATRSERPLVVFVVWRVMLTPTRCTIRDRASRPVTQIDAAAANACAAARRHTLPQPPARQRIRRLLPRTTADGAGSRHLTRRE
jgi:hypothetical protein